MKKWVCGMLCFACIALLFGCQTKEEESLSEETPQEKEQSVALTFTGDLLFEQSLYDSWENYAFDDYFDRLKPYLCGDLVVGNQEVPIAGEDLGVSGVAYSFNAPDVIASQLADVGFNVLTMANNHVYDRGYEGVCQTIDNLKENDITPVGIYADEESAHSICVIEQNGIKIAFLAYTYDTNSSFEEEYPFVTKTFLNSSGQFDEAHRQMLKDDVTAAQEQADVVIVAMHWGTEFTFTLDQAQQEAAIYLNDLGVDIVIGNHPHCLQTMERMINHDGKETLIFYSLGNLVSAAAMVDRASVDFANLYEMGAVVNLNVVMDVETREVRIEDVKLTPYINHFDVNYEHFQLIPLKDYTEELAQAHCQRQYSYNFNKEWLQARIYELFDRKVYLDL